MYHKLKNKSFLFLLLLSIPILLEFYLQGSHNYIDSIFATYFNKDTLPYLYTDDIFRIVNAILYAFGSSFVFLFAKHTINKEQRSLFIKQSLVIVSSLSIIIMLLSILFYKPLLFSFGITLPILPRITPYFILNVLSLPLLSSSILLSIYLRIEHHYLSPVLAYLSGVILHIFLNFIFPPSSISFGLSSLLSRVFTFIILYTLVNKKLHLNKQSLHFSFSLVKDFLYYGGIASLDRLLNRVGIILFYIITFMAGFEAYQAYQYYGQIEQLILIPIIAMTYAISILTTYALQEHDYLFISTLLQKMKRTAIVLTSIFGVFLILLAPTLAALSTSDPSTYRYTVFLLLMIGCVQPFAGIPIVYQATMKMNGDVISPLYINIIGTYGIRLVLCTVLTLYFQLGLLGILLAYAADLLFKGLYCPYHYHKELKRKESTYESYSTTSVSSF